MNARAPFSPPALRRSDRPATPAPAEPSVSIVDVRSFRLGRRRVAEVEVSIGPVAVRVLVSGGRVLLPSLRGEEGVTFSSDALRRAVEDAATEEAGRVAR